jgi:heme-degrading monooxygenase HmoA
MIQRIVKMEFLPEQTDSFLEYFEGRKERIRNFDGCAHLELWRDEHNPCIFFTYSWWQSEIFLHQYRQSEFFDETWRATKAKFAAKAEAWTVSAIHKL